MIGPNWLPNSEWQARSTRVLIARLSSYSDTLYSSTHRLLYGLLQKNPNIFVDLAFCPTSEPIHWTSMGSKYGAKEFDCVAISNALVQELINLPPLLKGSGIPLLKSERLIHETIPLVILGGANSLHTSLLWQSDPWVDGIYVGESLSSIEDLFNQFSKTKKDGLTKKEILKHLAQHVPGFFEPESVRSKSVKVIKPKGGMEVIHDIKALEPWMPDRDLAAVSSLHISEGCPSFCSFCAESYSRKPYRELQANQALEQALDLKQKLGLESIDLFSFNFNQHSQIHFLLQQLLNHFDSIGLKSQRFDALADDDVLPTLMKYAGKNSLTCGLEGISRRMRTFLQKGLSTDVLNRAIDRILLMPLRELKIFLIVTGKEEDADFEEFKQWLMGFSTQIRRRSKGVRVVFSATPLVRFPWTPLEFDSAPPATLSGKLVRKIKFHVVNSGFEFREAATEWESQVSQILVWAQQSSIASALVQAQEKTGFIYSDGIPEEFSTAFDQALTEHGVDPLKCLEAPQSEEDRIWTQVSPGISRDFIKQVYQKSISEMDHEICLGKIEQRGICSQCDACVPAERAAITVKRTEAKPIDMEWEKAILASKKSEQVFEFPVILNSKCIGWSVKTWTSWLARGLMQVSPELVSELRSFGKSDWENRLDQDYCKIAGKDKLRVSLTQKGATILEQLFNDLQWRKKVEQVWSPWMCWDPTPDQHAGIITCITSIPFNPERWFKEKGLKAMMRRQNTVMQWEFSKDSLKKKLIKQLSVTEELITNYELVPQSMIHNLKVHVLIDQKFDLIEFTRSCFTLNRNWPEWVFQ